jgi:hypothetical protein
MSSTAEPVSEGEDGLFKYRKKILKMKIIFASGVGTICLLAGFKYGYAKSKVKHGSSAISKDAKLEDPVKFAGRALKRATLITVGCFVVGISAISIGFGIHSFTDLRNISRRKWLDQNNDPKTDSTQVDKPDIPLDSNVLTNPLTDTTNNEIIIDKAEELTDKWR